MNRLQLIALSAAKFLTGGGRTIAVGAREFNDEFINSALIKDNDADAAGGYASVDSNGRINTGLVTSASPSGLFLRDDGTWQSTGGDTMTESTVDITGLTTINLSAISDNIIILTSSNAAETIDTIVISRRARIYFYPESGLQLTFVNSGNLQLYAPSLMADGSLFGFFYMGTRGGTSDIFQLNFIDQYA